MIIIISIVNILQQSLTTGCTSEMHSFSSTVSKEVVGHSRSSPSVTSRDEHRIVSKESKCYNSISETRHALCSHCLNNASAVSADKLWSDEETVEIYKLRIVTFRPDSSIKRSTEWKLMEIPHPASHVLIISLVTRGIYFIIRHSGWII